MISKKLFWSGAAIGSITISLFYLLFLYSWGYLNHPTIQVTSVNRPHAQPPFAAEIVTFSIKGVNAEKLFWIIDEKIVLIGGTEIEYHVPFEEKRAPGIVTVHRLDVLYKIGPIYHSTSTAVGVLNSDFEARLKLHDETLFLDAPRTFNHNWSLTSVGFVVYFNNKFKPGRTFQIPQRTGANEEQETRLSVPLTTISPETYAKYVSRSGITWIQYMFRNKLNNEELVLIKPLRLP
ncbi:hypothetical protein ACFL27_24605 [candidate division CSSED10-310 bacterium]|uniref:Uncharacterized protein n=1 Tax=candidate division CSSED10-310 bacterium TaxID=2855610 RepID=A0ABV6Z4M6_UNCC1